MITRKGFTLIELLITISIIAILSVSVFLVLTPVRQNARDARRKSDIAQIGRILVVGCYVPHSGEGDYDLFQVLTELKSNNPQYSNFISQIPRDPSKGTNTESFYRYIVNASAKKCAIYGNLENSGEKITLSGISFPAAGGGTGVLESLENGWNGTKKYFQFSN